MKKKKKKLVTKNLWTEVIGNCNIDDVVHTSKSKVKSSCQGAKQKG